MSTTTEIHIYGPNSILKGEFPLGIVRTATSYPVEGAQFSKAYRKGLWDGRTHLFNKTTHSFPTGLVPLVKTTLEAFGGTEVVIVDHREEPTPGGRHFDLVGVKMEGKYSYQLDACKSMIKNKQGIVRVATGGGKTELSCAVVRYLDLPTLFLVSTRELLYQARERFKKRLAYDDSEVGIIGDGHWEPGTKVTIAMIPTLESRLDTTECQKFLATIDVLFIDECHHMGSETWYTICTLCPAYYRFGLSGTPLDRTDGANLRLIAATGDVIVNIDNKFLVENGISAKADIIWDKITDPILDKKKKIPYSTVYKQCISENPALLTRVVEWTKVFAELKMGTLILVEEIQHGKLIDDALWNNTGGMFIPHMFIHGTEDTDIRTKAISDFGSGNLPVLIASTILDEGVDVPTIDALILAGSRKSRIRTMQRLGRGLRGSKLVVVEFANFGHKYVIEHSLQRMEDYKKEECFDIYNSGPDIDLVRKLWEK